MYEARWQNGNPQWMKIDAVEAARLLAGYPSGPLAALAILNERHVETVTTYVAEHPAETNGMVQVRLREFQPYTRPTPKPEEDGEILWA